jgi:hypothetical protein
MMREIITNRLTLTVGMALSGAVILFPYFNVNVFFGALQKKI